MDQQAPHSIDKDLTELQRIRQALFGEDLCRINLRLKTIEDHMKAVVDNVQAYVSNLEKTFNQRLNAIQKSMTEEFNGRDEHLRAVQVSVAGMQQLYGSSLEKVQAELSETQQNLHEEIQGVESSLSGHLTEKDSALRSLVEKQGNEFSKGQVELGDMLVKLGGRLKGDQSAQPAEAPVFAKTNGHRKPAAEKLASN